MEDDDLIVIARITLTWGHIDTQIDQMLQRLYALDEGRFQHLFGTKMMQPKIEAIKAAASGCDDETVKPLLEKMCKAVSACASGRNDMTHGMWGWHFDDKTRSYEAAALNKPKNRVFFLKDLRDLHERVHQAHIYVDEAYYAYIEKKPVLLTRNRSLIFSKLPKPKDADPPPRFRR